MFFLRVDLVDLFCYYLSVFSFCLGWCLLKVNCFILVIGVWLLIVYFRE